MKSTDINVPRNADPVLYIPLVPAIAADFEVNAVQRAAYALAVAFRELTPAQKRCDNDGAAVYIVAESPVFEFGVSEGEKVFAVWGRAKPQVAANLSDEQRATFTRVLVDDFKETLR